MVRYKKGHKNSKGEDAPWTIVSCKTGKVLSSHKSKGAAEEHLQQMEYFKHAKNECADHPVTEGICDVAFATALGITPVVANATVQVGDFQTWLGEQPKTPVIEAVQQMYGALVDAKVDSET